MTLQLVSTRYVGPREHLQEKAVMAREIAGEPNTVEVKFNDIGTGYGTEWHRFPKSDFAKWSPKV